MSQCFIWPCLIGYSIAISFSNNSLAIFELRHLKMIKEIRGCSYIACSKRKWECLIDILICTDLLVLVPLNTIATYIAIAVILRDYVNYLYLYEKAFGSYFLTLYSRGYYIRHEFFTPSSILELSYICTFKHSYICYHYNFMHM